MRILFQGDSVTDAGRTELSCPDLGRGYPLIVAGLLGEENPEKYEFVNRGIGGNKSVDIYSRMKRDIINLKPDVLSILVGINDVWHEIDFNDGVSSDKYFKVYSMLIEEIMKELPNTKIMIMEPFFLKGTATEENYDYFEKEVTKRRINAKKIAEKYNLTFIPLQDKFLEKSKNTKTSYWLKDGVHPTVNGATLIAKEWISYFNKL